jgi:hypothetical protein
MQAHQEQQGAVHATPDDGERYGLLAAAFVSHFSACRSRSAQQLWASLDAACASLALEGKTPEAQLALLRDCLGRDLAHLASVLVRGTREEGAGISRLARQRGPLRLLLTALTLSGDGVFRIAGEAARPELRRAGEVTCGGTLECLRCGSTCRSTRALVARGCVECGHTEFAKALRA